MDQRKETKGNQLKVCLPPGKTVNFMGAELGFAEGQCAIIKVPPLGKLYLNQFIAAVKETGGTVENV